MKYILLHGLGQNSSSWKKTIAKLDKKADVVCPDLFALIQGREVNYANLYQALCEYCKKVPEPFTVCGLSLGGILALQYGIEHPESVNSMVLIGTQYVMPKRLLQLQNVVFHFVPKSAFKRMGLAKKAVINLSSSMMDLDFRQALHKIKCPVLLICGESDKPNMQASLNLKAQIPNAALIVIENAGHEINVDAPEKLSIVLNRFFNSNFPFVGEMPKTGEAANG